MIRHWHRLLQLWTVAARYRLDTLLPPPPMAAARLALLASACIQLGGQPARPRKTRPASASPLRRSARCSLSLANCWRHAATC